MKICANGEKMNINDKLFERSIITEAKGSADLYSAVIAALCLPKVFADNYIIKLANHDTHLQTADMQIVFRHSTAGILAFSHLICQHLVLHIICWYSTQVSLATWNYYALTTNGTQHSGMREQCTNAGKLHSTDTIKVINTGEV